MRSAWAGSFVRRNAPSSAVVALVFPPMWVTVALERGRNSESTTVPSTMRPSSATPAGRVSDGVTLFSLRQPAAETSVNRLAKSHDWSWFAGRDIRTLFQLPRRLNRLWERAFEERAPRLTGGQCRGRLGRHVLRESAEESGGQD